MRGSVKITAGIVGGIMYLVVGLVQINASVVGLEHLTEWWHPICWWLSWFIGWMPVIGTALGIYGAHAAWGWSLTSSVLLFLGIPLGAIGIVGLCSLIASGLSAIQMRRQRAI